LTSKIKEAIFYVFGESKLSPISMNASPNDVNKWKRSSNVRRCYDLLHKPISENDETSITYLMKIVEKIFADTDKATDTLVAYIICVCESFLDPENDVIQITESTIKDKLEESLVSFAILMLLDSN